MTESMIEQENDELEVLSFGEYLSIERKKQNISIAEVAQAVHLSEKIIDAIERSDVEQLPQPTFVQGYLRAYAKYLGISADPVLQEYAQSVPHQKEADLKLRSKLPGEASSNSPIVKMITILLLVLMVSAALYASFDYYKNAISSDDAESNDLATLSLPEVESYAQETVEPDASPESQQPLEVENIEEQNNIMDVDPVGSELSDKIAKQQTGEAVVIDDEGNQKPKNLLTSEGDDELELFAAQVSWVEVDDANGENLYYDLLQTDHRIVLKGAAPFKIFLGDAPQIKVKINNLSVSVEKYIRSNNIANFSISVDQQQVVFH